MRQPSKNPKVKRRNNSDGKKERDINPDNITSSKLEDYFATTFLDKLGIKYERQFKALSIGRYFDFFIPEQRVLIEIDGDYYHGNPQKYKKNQLNNMQLKNKRIDEVKNRWADINCIKLIRLWESDIRKNPKVIFDKLKQM